MSSPFSIKTALLFTGANKADDFLLSLRENGSRVCGIGREAISQGQVGQEHHIPSPDSDMAS